MKGYISVLFVAALLLTGCSTTAGTAYIPTQATHAAQPTESSVSAELSESTEATAATEAAAEPLDCDNDSRLMLVPKLGTNVHWEVDEFNEPSDFSLLIKTYDLTLEEAKEYVQALAAAGFSQERFDRSLFYTYYIDGKAVEREYYTFSAFNETYDVVTLNCEYDNTSGDPDRWLCRLMVLRLPDETKLSPDAVKNETDWNAEPLLALVPQPPTEYWSTFVHPTLQYQEYITVKLEAMSMTQVRAYAAALRESGFDYEQMEISSTGIYIYSAANSDGYITEVYYSVNRDPRAYLLVYPESVRPISRWRDILYREEYIPEPEGMVDEWTYVHAIIGENVKLHGMDYREALEYIDMIRQRVADIQWKFRKGETWVQDEENQYLECEMYILWPQTPTINVGFDWTLIYDPANEECPCMLVKD